MSNVSVVIPALSEKNNIKKLIHEIYEVMISSSYIFEVIFVIGKEEQLSIDKKFDNLHIINRQENNFSSALIHGIRWAKNDILITLDSDGSHSFLEVTSYLDYFINNKLDILIFSRYLDKSSNNENVLNVIFSKLLNNTLRLFSSLKLTDYSNNLRIFKKSMISKHSYKSIHFEFLYEFLFKAKQSFPKLKIEEVPTIHSKRKHGRSKKNHIFYLLNYVFLIIKLRLK